MIYVRLCLGILPVFSTGLTFVATDAHKLVKYARTDVTASQVADFIMPKKPLKHFKKYSWNFRCK
jgi:hypothetical protein